MYKSPELAPEPFKDVASVITQALCTEVAGADWVIVLYRLS